MAPKAKYCEFCNKKFYPKSNAGKICPSLLCLRKQRKRSQDKWEGKNKRKMKAYRKMWFLDNRERLKDVRRAYYLKNIMAIKVKHRAYGKSINRKLMLEKRNSKRPGIRLEEGHLYYNFGTCKIDREVRKIAALCQLLKRGWDGKIDFDLIPEKIKLIKKGKTYEGYK